MAPTAELAQALQAAVERRHIDAGHLLWPTPRIRDLRGWLRDCHERRLIADSSTPRCLTDLEEREVWRSVIHDSALGAEFPDPSGAVRAARRARRAVKDHDIPAEAIAACDSQEAQALLDWMRAFEERCRDLGCISVDELAATFDRAPEPVSWVESPVWSPAAHRWLRRHGLGMLRPGDATVPAVMQVLHAPSAAVELAAVAQWARAGLEADPGFRAWICLPDLGLRRAQCADAFDAALAPRRFSLTAAESVAPYAIAGGTALADYPPVRAALELLSGAASGLSFERFSAMLRGGDWHEPAEAAPVAALDVALRRAAPSEAPLDVWVALCERLAAAQGLAPVAAVARLRAACTALARRSGRQPLSGWVPVWIGAFEAGPWSQRHRWSSGEFQAAERLRNLLAELAGADPMFGPLARGAAERILGAAAREVAFQPQTGVTPIWISGQLSDPWLACDAIWLAGAGEENWPPAPDPVPLLPVRLQREYGVIAASAESQLRFAQDLQERWRRRAARLMFSFADAGDYRPSAPSSLLADAGPPLECTAEPQPHWRPIIDAAPAMESLNDEVAPPFDPAERTRGVATLRAQSQCPFRGFAHTRLKADRLEIPMPGFDERERGTLVHHALEHVWTILGGSAGLAAMPAGALAALLDGAALQAIARVSAGRDPGPRWRERERRRLTRLLARWLEVERLRPAFEVERLEQGKEPAYHGGVGFTVRIDRIDRLADGARVLIDYKTGTATRDWRGERPGNPQLPVYSLLRPDGLVAVAYGQVNAGECRFVAEAERPAVFAGSRQTALEGRASMAELLQVWAQRIDALAADFAAGRARVDPIPQACRHCHLQILCRVRA